MERISSETFCGRTFRGDELAEIAEIIRDCHGLSRTELANTVCELFNFKRPSGRLKTIECRQFLEYLDIKGVIDLPDRKKGRPRGVKSKVKRTDKGQVHRIISGKVKEFSPLALSRVTSKEQRDLWYEYIDRYHYLGYQLPFGAQLRYFIESTKRVKNILGCLQFSSPAWKMAARDRWIGWNDEQRQRNLQKVINNSRFLIFPWVKVKNLASSVLALASRVVPDDWQRSYGYRPVLLETLVDKRKFKGTCYKASNWIYVGTTTGRGRMDRENKRQGLSPKEIYMYPLTCRFREELVGL
ncbi:MAG: DUF4338 domain-containing protein [Candidatus Hodarchaeota archaeon]